MTSAVIWWTQFWIGKSGCYSQGMPLKYDDDGKPQIGSNIFSVV